MTARRDDAVVIEVARNGVHTKARAALVPTTPDEIAAGARDCSNAELVEEVVALANEVGRRVASPAETAKLFGFPRA